MPFMSSLHLQIPNPLLDNQFSMSAFTGNGSDGDLQAVVRGFNNSFSSYTTMDYPQTCFSPLIIEDDGAFFCSFPDFCERNTVLDELKELYKPFYPTLNPFSSEIVVSSSVSGQERELETVQENEAFPGSPAVSPPPAATHSLAVKYKRKKTQHKRVVVEVAAEGLSSDLWAWRKYGQKPIKGSPYPRSYYRCSSSKGCLARKQVERSQSDSQMFVITYTAEHCHGHPSRKSSLAGTTRHEFSHSKSPATAGDPKQSIPTDSGCSSSPPITPLVMEKKSIREEEERVDEASKTNGLDTFDVMLSDDFFLSFDELDRLTSDITCNN